MRNYVLFFNLNQIVARSVCMSTATFHTTPPGASFGRELQCLPPGWGSFLLVFTELTKATQPQQTYPHKDF
jgi:hypothetical protein